MRIEKDKVASFNYHLREEGGETLENNSEGIPIAYLHGHGNLLPALESALENLQAGDTISVTLPPEQAYGPVKPNLTQRVPVKHLLSKHKRLNNGSLVRVQTERGPVTGRVVKAGKFVVDVDFNHPFAGKTLVFDISIKEVRDASLEELQHGHAHGAGGHHH